MDSERKRWLEPQRHALGRLLASLLAGTAVQTAQTRLTGLGSNANTSTCVLCITCALHSKAARLQLCPPATRRRPPPLTDTAEAEEVAVKHRLLLRKGWNNKRRRRRRGGRKDKRQIWKTAVVLALARVKDLIKMDLEHLHSSPVAAPTSSKLIDQRYRTNGGRDETQTDNPGPRAAPLPLPNAVRITQG